MTSAIFSQEVFRFFRELGRHNRKEWMDANRERYRAHVVEPFRVLLAGLAPIALKLNPDFDIGGRTGTNFSRINRDIRFAADKTPYRAQMYLMFCGRGTDGDGGQLYVGVSADAVTAGFRIYGSGRDSRLAKIAAPRVMENAKWLEARARRLGRKFESYWYTAEKGDWTRHDGWPAKPDDWKKLKGWVVRRKMPLAAATRGGFVTEVAKIFREVFPLYQITSAEKWRP